MFVSIKFNLKFDQLFASAKSLWNWISKQNITRNEIFSIEILYHGFDTIIDNLVRIASPWKLRKYI